MHAESRVYEGSVYQQRECPKVSAAAAKVVRRFRLEGLRCIRQSSEPPHEGCNVACRKLELRIDVPASLLSGAELDRSTVGHRKTQCQEAVDRS